MASKKSPKKGRSGNPRKAAEQAAAANAVKNPCLHCGENERGKALWCQSCVTKAKRQARIAGGGMFGRKVDEATRRRTIIGMAREFGMLDEDGNLTPEALAA